MKNVAIIPTQNMRNFLEKEQKLNLEMLLLKSKTTAEERKYLRCVEFNEDGVSYKRDQVVDLIQQAEELLLKASELCPEDNAEVLLVMAKHVAQCAHQAGNVDITEFYDRTPCQPTQEQWVVMRDIVSQQVSEVTEEPTAQVVRIEDLRARREEANRLAAEEAKKSSYAAFNGGSAS